MKRIMSEEFRDSQEESAYDVLSKQSVLWGPPPVSQIQVAKIPRAVDNEVDNSRIDTPPGRISTGLSGLDVRLHGGIPKNSVIVLEVKPNNFTYAFQQQFLEIALAQGAPGIYFCVERSPCRVIESMTRQGIAAKRYMEEGLLIFVDFYRTRGREITVWDDECVIPQVVEGVLPIGDASDKDNIKIALDVVREHISSNNDMRIVVESTPYILPEADALSAARFWEGAMKTFSDSNPTILYSFPLGADDQLLAVIEGRADGIFSMHPVEMLGMTEVKLEVKKMIHTPRLPRDLYIIEEQSGKINVQILGRIK
jgi:KaiC/GvpD/RAD55 family RecA-like ATPase